MSVWLRHLLGWLIAVLRLREDLAFENLALRQQLLTFTPNALVGGTAP